MWYWISAKISIGYCGHLDAVCWQKYEASICNLNFPWGIAMFQQLGSQFLHKTQSLGMLAFWRDKLIGCVGCIFGWYIIYLTFCIDEIIFKADNCFDNLQLCKIPVFFALKFIELNVSEFVCHIKEIHQYKLTIDKYIIHRWHTHIVSPDEFLK